MKRLETPGRERHETRCNLVCFVSFAALVFYRKKIKDITRNMGIRINPE